MIIQEELDIMQKLTILSDAAKYDASCASSGVSKKNNGVGIGNSSAAGICHTFTADGRCVSLLKILFTNECIFNCKYCINRSSNDVVRATFTPEEVCSLTMEFYRRNYIEGLFLSSGIIISPDETMKRLLETVMLLRNKYHFGGYIHLKAIPGASQDIIDMAGWFVDRMSVNLELPTADGLKKLAPGKSRENILKPMRRIQAGINNSKMYLKDINHYDDGNNNIVNPDSMISDINMINDANKFLGYNLQASFHSPVVKRQQKKHFVPAGQSTQMIVGATDETDYHLMTVTDSLYKNFGLKRVYYSAFININNDDSLPFQESKEAVPLLREHRLYQADWLLRFYGFKVTELLSENKPNFNVLIDPKCDWALRNLDRFPVEINKADYYTLLRVPGIGVNSAKRIIKARRTAIIDFNDLKKMGVVLKRAIFFITCKGKMLVKFPYNEDYIVNELISTQQRERYRIEDKQSFRQLSLFDDFNVAN